MPQVIKLFISLFKKPLQSFRLEGEEKERKKKKKKKDDEWIQIVLVSSQSAGKIWRLKTPHCQRRMIKIELAKPAGHASIKNFSFESQVLL